MAQCHSRTQRERYVEAAAPFVASAVAKLTRAMPAYLRVVDVMREDVGVVEVVGGVVVGDGRVEGKGRGLGGELERFRGVARGFRERVEGVEELVGVCEALEELAGVVAGVEEGVVGAAEGVVKGGEAVEVGRVALAKRVVEMREGRGLGVSFVE